MQNKDKELWEDIKGYEGLYQISDRGQVKSLRKNKILKPWICNKYYAIELWRANRRKKRFIHRLIAMAYVDNPYMLNVVHHKDFDRLNNNISNLEWVEQSENVYYSKTKMF